MLTPSRYQLIRLDSICFTDACFLTLITESNDVSRGFHKGRKLKKLGTHGQDTAELFFEDVRVPGSALLGEVPRR